MTTIVIRASAVAFALFTAQFIFASPKPLHFANSRLMSDLQQLDTDPYIIDILKQHEHEFPGAIRYQDLHFYTPLGRLARVQRGALDELKSSSPDFVAKWSEKKDLKDIEVSVVAPLIVSEAARKFSAFEWYWLKQRWARQLDKARDSSNKFTPANLEKLIEMLDEHESAGSEDPLAYDWYEAEGALGAFIIAGSILKANDTATNQELSDKIKDADVGALDYLKDPLAAEPLLARLKNPSAAGARLESIRKSIIETLYKDSESIELSPGQSIKLREVHPKIAIFRGYVGNDCSTSFSPGFVFTPYDRYFYVFGADGVSLGYVGLTMVHSGGRPAAFIHTIQGPNISASQTELILRAVTQSALEVLGTDQVLLGPDESIRSNVNFVQIEETMERVVNGKIPVPMEFHDMEIRKIIAKWESTLEYDNPERNRFGRKLEFSETNLLQIRTTSRSFDSSFARPQTNTGACERFITGR